MRRSGGFDASSAAVSRRRWLRFKNIAITLFAGTLLVSCCLGVADAPPGRSQRSNLTLGVADALPGGSQRSNLTLAYSSPLKQYRLSPVEWARVQRARMVSITRCALRFGVEVGLGPSITELAAADTRDESQALSRLYGITDQLSAAKFGYGLPPEAHAPPGEASYINNAWFAYVLFGLTPRTASQKPQFGRADQVPAGGCSGEADRLLHVDASHSPYGQAHDLWIRNRRELQHSRAWSEVVDDWAECLRSRGYRVTDPVSDRGDIRQVWSRRAALGLDRPVPGETALALADIGCKRKVRLVERLAVAARRLDDVTLRENREALETDRRRLDGQVALSEALLGAHR